jgi:hypothetical protein
MRTPHEPRLHAPAAPERTLRRLPIATHRRRDRVWRRAVRRVARLLVPISVLCGLAAWLLSSPVFALREFTVEGESRVPRPWIDGALSGWRGANLLRLDLREVEARLRAHRWVRAVALHKRLPDHLAVEIQEHQPIAILAVGEDAHYVSSEARLIAPAPSAGTPSRSAGTPSRSAGAPAPGAGTPVQADEALLVLRVDDVAARSLLDPTGDRPTAEGLAAVRGALAVAGALRESALHWAGEASDVVLVSDEDYRVTLRGLAFPIVVRPDTPRTRIEAFDRLLPALEREVGPLELADLRFTRRIVVRPRSKEAPPQRPAFELRSPDPKLPGAPASEAIE